MSYEPLHHKYRPQTFAQLVGQEAIATTLTNAIAREKIAPAYLFAGPRGTGKTSSARILAKSLNCLSSERPTANPCGKCEVCRSIARGSALDVIEIDAASNTGVDNIREIIEKAQFAPVQCRYKVYVIDECHMLSTAAFNALLKTLEEPPARVIFVLATTDPQRVLPTIISRCQRFDYRRIPLEAMAAHLQHIATEENIEITPEAITVVAQIANGGLRDAESLLDQLSLLAGTIAPEQVWDLVGAVAERDLLELIKAVASNQAEVVLSQCRKLMDRGREPLVVLQNLANFYLHLLIAKTAPSRADLIAVTENTWQQLCQEVQTWETEAILQGQKQLKDSEVQIKNTTQPRLWLEVTLLGLLPSAMNAASSSAPVISSPSTVTPQLPPAHSSTQTADRHQVIQPKPTPSSRPEMPELIPEPEKSEIPATANLPLNQLKQQVLRNIQHLTTQAFFKEHCKLISFDGVMATVAVRNECLFKVAKEKLPQLESAFRKVFQQQIRINFQLGNTADFTEDELENINHSELQPTKLVERIEPKAPDKSIVKTTEGNSHQAQPSSKTDSSVEKLPQVKTTNEPVREQETKAVIKYSTSTEAKKAAENLAQNFGGEIVISETKIIQPLVINRPHLPNLDQDEMPF
jgi:DNA polymerase-3 subunit gamma/tau